MMKERNKSLDFLRGLAILLVLLRHYPFDFDFMPSYVEHIFIQIKNVGYIGVDLFFVLSGFLVSGLYFSKVKQGKDPGVKNFLTRRALKIWPSYYIYLAFILVFYSYKFSFEKSWDMYKSAVFHVQNYIVTYKVHLWSLAIEEHFYALLSLIVLLLARIDFNNFQKNIKRFTFVCVFLPMVFRFLLPDHHTYMSHIRSDGLFIGVLISSFYYFNYDWFKSLSRFQVPLFFLALTLIAPVFYYVDLSNTERYARTFSFLALHTGFGILLICALNAGPNSLRYLINSGLGKIFQKFGILSYGIYLWHIEFNGVFGISMGKLIKGKLSTLQSITAQTAYFLLLYLLGLVLMNFIEKPFLTLREKVTKTTN